MTETDARRAAWRFLNRLDRGDKTLDALIDEEVKDFSSQRERAFFNALVYGVLRWRGRLDWVIGQFSKISLNKIDPDILNLLRLGLFQIAHLDKVPAAAAVHSAVEMAKSGAPPWVVKFVNANLRKIADNYKTVTFPDITRSPLPALSVRKSFPQWLIKRWLARFGSDETAALCDAINTIPPITLRTNTLKTDRQALVDALCSEAEEIWQTKFVPNGVSIRGLKRPVAVMPAFQQGWFQVQDEAAQLAVLLVGAQPGERILDACAGLGGKTGYLAQLMENRGEIVALDVDADKLKQAANEMTRLGVGMVQTRCHDLEKGISPDQVGTFDRVLVDAPCSGLGVLRRNPDIKWSLLEKDLKRLGARQARFLENLAGLVKPAGLLVYMVCSTEPEENENVINDFLNKRKDFVIDPESGRLPDNGDGFLMKGYFKTSPYKNGMDGFFSARLRRVI